jgi:putative inorganic carbon (HCO3(-)) transporter
VRDVLIVAIIAAWVPVALVRPWLGIVGWTILSIMNPHRYTWRASEWPLAAAMALATLIGVLITRDRRNWSVSAPAAALIAFMAWITVTLPFSFSVTDSFDMWQRVMKIDLMILVALVVLTTRQHVMVLAWVLACSIGFYGFKGGLFTILNGGVYRVWGPPGGFIEGNNEIALALVITIPLMRFLQLEAKSRWTRTGLTLLMVLSAAAAVGTQSRGALLALLAMAVMLLLRGGGSKLLFGAMLLGVAAGLVVLMPSTWDDRMSTIVDYQSDGSAMGRINAWWAMWNLARDKIFGGGFAIYDPSTFARYAPNPNDIHAAHSIYFQVLGEHGFIGLALFLLIGFLIWRNAGWLRRNCTQLNGLAWAGRLGAMCQVSLAGFAVGGAFLSLAYFDLPYNLLVLVVVARRCVEEQLAILPVEKPLAPSAGQLDAAPNPGVSMAKPH